MSATPVAVLCAARNSIYHTLPDLDVYDITRDARTFSGGLPVVAHPPCRAWSAFCRHQAKPDPGEAELGPMCVEWVRRCGGVLEHPAHSRLWDACGLPRPGQGRDTYGGVTLCVDQSWWGDTRSKRTWLYAVGAYDIDLPFRLHDPRGDRGRWNSLSKHRRAATPPAMARWLVALARTAIGQLVNT